MTDALIKAIKSLINDIEAMRCIPDDSIEDSGHWFGLFSRHCFDWDDGASIEWPNLAISLEEVKTALEQAINNNAALDEAIKDAIFMFKDIEKARELPPFAHVQAQYVATGRNLEKAYQQATPGEKMKANHERLMKVLFDAGIPVDKSEEEE